MWTMIRPTGLVTVALLLVALVGSNPSSAEEGPYPGLPPAQTTPDYLTSRWTGLAQGGVSKVRPAKQWARVPLQTAAVNNRLAFRAGGGPGVISTNSTRNLVYFVGPRGSEHNYGITPEFAVQTVAFGAVPVVATVQVAQLRDSRGLPEPLVVEALDTFHEEGPSGPRERQYHDTEVEEEVYLHVTGLTIDGISVGLRPGCRTSSAGRLRLHGKGAWQRDPELNVSSPWLTGHFIPNNGGLLVGTVDVPDFGPCRTRSGDDVARLLSGTVSGPGNPVRLHVSNASACRQVVDGQVLPPAPGMTTPEEAGCIPTLVPPQLEIPTAAN